MTQLHLIAALEGTGYHPASWRHPSARPAELFQPGYWAHLGRTAERARLDAVTLEDGFGLQTARRNQPDQRVDQVRGRLEANLLASFIAPHTSHIGLIPTAVPTHSEPFHIASSISTLDWVSGGRAGWRPQVSSRADEASLVGRRAVPEVELARRDDPQVQQLMADLFDEASDVVEVVRRLWDSWEDDAIIKDVATGRFVDRDKLHYVDFEGRFFAVKGPSIVPRPPQGQPLVLALAHQLIPFRFAARSADVVCVTPSDQADVARWVGDIRQAEVDVARTGPPLRILADLVVFLDDSAQAARDRRADLDRLDGHPWRTDCAIVTASPAELADLLLAWAGEGLDGFRIRPAVIGHDLDRFVDEVVPRLQAAGAFRTAYAEDTLRPRFGLDRPANRYATVTP